MPIRVAVDAMGGDHGPEVMVRGALQAAADCTDLSLSFVGDRSAIESVLQSCDTASVASRIDLVHASTVVGMEEGAIEALKRSPDSSVVRLV